jgi:RNA polymerase sigma-70 factor, ECF subfamily
LYSETQLIQACLKNNHEAQKQFYLRYAPLLKGICLRYEKDRDKVSDILQEIFIKLYKNLDKFSGEGSFEGLLKRLTVNHCIDHVSKNKKLFEVSLSDSDDFVSSESDNESDIISQLIDAGYNKQMLLDVLHGLPINYGSVFNLYYIDQWSHQEIASHLNITEALSRKWLFRAKDLIKKQLLLILESKTNQKGAYEKI